MCDDQAATDPRSSYEINVCKGIKQTKIIRITLKLLKVWTQKTSERFTSLPTGYW